MNLRPLLAFLAVMPLLSGCVVGNRAKPGDVNVTWTFQGYRCADDPRIATVHIEIPGEVLQNNGDYACTNSAGSDSILLANFRGGTYSFNASAYDAHGNLLYGPATGSFVVNGSVTVAVDFAPAGGGSIAQVFLQWYLSPTQDSDNPLCADAIPGSGTSGITDVFVYLDGSNQPYADVSCASGQTQTGAGLGLLPSGTHHVYLSAVDSTGFEYEFADGNINVVGSQAQVFPFNLNWSVGGADVGFRLFNGTVAQTCAQAGVTTVAFNFQDTTTGVGLYGPVNNTSSWSTVDCGDPHEVYFPYLPPGTYHVLVVGSGPGAVVYQDTSGTFHDVTVGAGLFPTSVNVSVDLDKT